MIAYVSLSIVEGQSQVSWQGGNSGITALLVFRKKNEKTNWINP